MLINYYTLLLHKKNEVDPCESKNNEVELGGFRGKSKWTIIGIINGFHLVKSNQSTSRVITMDTQHFKVLYGYSYSNETNYIWCEKGICFENKTFQKV